MNIPRLLTHALHASGVWCVALGPNGPIDYCQSPCPRARRRSDDAE